MNITGALARTLLDQIETDPGTPSKETSFLSFLIVKNLSDLCETGRGILSEMIESGISTTGLPDDRIMGTIQKILQEFYLDTMFKEHADYGQVPNWVVINKFPSVNARAAWQLYRIMRRNIQNSTKMPEALERRDKKFFVENFDYMFENVPFKDLINQFKNFIGSDNVPGESQELVWGYFEALINIIGNEKTHIELIKSL